MHFITTRNITIYSFLKIKGLLMIFINKTLILSFQVVITRISGYVYKHIGRYQRIFVPVYAFFIFVGNLKT
ncbi:MAG: hypothetical protein CVU09_07370 [Bacteroidetes bacterium HGW-Bacteroidetes-4]|nr:MAG: hypothetical protein CVU09_07370 [Bacteroidetes bacterium HGW-Bacteroidetes-4]